jgi:hypothetical protein
LQNLGAVAAFREPRCKNGNSVVKELWQIKKNYAMMKFAHLREPLWD